MAELYFCVHTRIESKINVWTKSSLHVIKALNQGGPDIVICSLLLYIATSMVPIPAIRYWTGHGVVLIEIDPSLTT